LTAEERIRKQLSQVLEKDPGNYSKILELSSKLAAFDTDFIRFTVDAGVVDRLGKELVARQETAVSELVKNAYDADATTVNITFLNSEVEGGCVTIEDNGDGMTRDELVNGFMRISATTKIHNPVSPKYNRKRAGKKGIGRFAVQRLGIKLTIITQTESSKTALKLSINWDDYSNDKNLLQISNKLEEVPKTKAKGTTLTIDVLRDKWTEASIKRIFKYVSAIIQPYPLSKSVKQGELKRQRQTLDPGFKVTFFKVKKGGTPEAIADENLMVFNYAAAVIEGYVDKNGNGVYSVDSTKLGISKVEKIGLDRDNKKRWNFLKNIHFRAYYFIYHPDFVPSQQRTSIQELAEESGGIRLYNNGFRVLPYGEPFVDWLKLDQSVRKRIILPAHGNNSFFGFVEVTNESGLLEETSSREGLQENAAFEELTNFLYRSLVSGVLEVARVRGTKQTASQKTWEKKKPKPNEVIKDVANQITEAADVLAADKGSNKQVINKLRDFAYTIIEAAKEQHEEEAKLIEELAMVRVLASLGLSIGEFTHEIRHYLGTLEAKTKVLTKEVSARTSLGKKIEQLHNNIHRLRIYASYYDRTISDNVIRDLMPQDLAKTLTQFQEVIRPDINRNSITVEELEIDGLDLFTVPMHPSELVSILFNLYTNSKKAIARAEVKGKILISAGREKKKLFIEFADNGDGISPDIEDKIFDAFFTTSSPAGHSVSHQEEVVGTGLGLKIVSDILTAYGGTIELVSPPKGYVTCFRIELPEFSDK
jgi:signal transduction histidine kinase